MRTALLPSSGSSIRSHSANARPITRSLWLANLEALTMDPTNRHTTLAIDLEHPLIRGNDIIVRHSLTNWERWKCEVVFWHYEPKSVFLKCTSTVASSARAARAARAVPEFREFLELLDVVGFRMFLDVQYIRSGWRAPGASHFTFENLWNF